MSERMEPQGQPVANWLARLLTYVGYILAIPLFWLAIRIVQEYERGVIFRLGRLMGARGPGLFFIIPFVERMIKVDLRIVTMDVPRQEAITRDNVTVRVDAVVYFRVVNPEDAVVKVADYIRATALIAQTTLRNVIGQSDLDDLLSRREQVNQRLQQMIDEATEPWGVKVTAVEVRDVNLAPEMIRAIARQAEAERERRAKVINAEGEFQAAQRLSEAAIVMAQNPISVQLRFLQTLSEISTERNSTVVFPIPIDLLSIFYDRARAMAGPQAPAAGGQSPPATAPDG